MGHHRRIGFPIRYKLALFVIGVVALAIATVSAVYYFDTKRILQAEILANFSELADTRADQLILMTALDSVVAKSFATRTLLWEYLNARASGAEDGVRLMAKAQQSLADAMQASGRVVQVDVLDRYGKVIVSSDGKAIGGDFSRAEGFRRGREDLYAGDPYLLAGKPCYDLYLPVYDREGDTGKAPGVMRCVVSLEEIFGLIGDYRRLGETGEYVLGRLDGSDILFLSPLRFCLAPPFTFRTPLDGAPAEPMRRAVKGGAGVMQGIDYRGVPVLAAYQYIPIRRWGLVTKMDIEEAFLPVRRLLRHVILVAGGVFLGSVFLVFLFAAIFTRPLNRLREGIERISAGDLDSRVGVTSNDEIGEVSRLFDLMVKNLKLVTASRNDLNREVAERREAQTLLQRRTTELVDALRVRTDFASTVSHELRTPLAAIKGSIDVVTGGMAGTISEKQRKYLDMAKKNVDRLDRLISDVLDFRKLEAGKMEYRMRMDDINDTITEVRDIMLPAAQEKEIGFILALGSDVARTSFDRDRIVQVLVNLISNAIKFTQKGTLTVSTKMAGDVIHVLVADTGEGMHADDMTKLFQPFIQIRRKPGGSGLGLVISKDIVEAHGGRMWLESVLGKGTTVTFTLPVKNAEA